MLFEFLSNDENDRKKRIRQASAVFQARTRKFDAFLANGNYEERLALVQNDIDAIASETAEEFGLDPDHFLVSSVREARRPKMCPYHSEVVDVSLGTGNPEAGYTAMAQHATSESSCKGGFDGKCNFKPQMVTQSFWDDRDQAARDRVEQRKLQVSEPVSQDLNELEIPNSDADMVEQSEGFDDDFDGIDAQLSQAPSAIGEPALARRVGAYVERPLIHSGSLDPLRKIEARKPGFMINGQPLEQFASTIDPNAGMATASQPVEITHPIPKWENVGQQILTAGHEGPLMAAMNAAKQRAQQRQQMPGVPGPQNNVAPFPAQASIRQAEALEHQDIEKDTWPTLDKRKWTPNNVKPIDTEMSGSPHPTKQVDVTLPAEYDSTGYTDDSAVLEHQDADKRWNNPGSGPTKTWTENEGASPVTHTTQSAVDPEKNPIRESVESLPTEEEVRRAILAYDMPGGMPPTEPATHADPNIQEGQGWLQDVFENVPYDITPEEIKEAINHHYQGGWQQFLSDGGLQESPTPALPEVEQAHQQLQQPGGQF